jgi:hypothetical protein
VCICIEFIGYIEKYLLLNSIIYRIWPTYALCILFMVGIGGYIGDGPLWE